MDNFNAQFISSSPYTSSGSEEASTTGNRTFPLTLARQPYVCVFGHKSSSFREWVPLARYLIPHTPYLASFSALPWPDHCLSVVGSVCHAGTYLLFNCPRAPPEQIDQRSHVWQGLLNHHHCPKIAGQLIFPSVAVNPITHTHRSNCSSSSWFRSQAMYSRDASVIRGHQLRSRARNFCRFSAISSTPSSVILLQPDKESTVKCGREWTVEEIKPRRRRVKIDSIPFPKWRDIKVSVDTSN